jgi:hypothetical protein
MVGPARNWDMLVNRRPVSGPVAGFRLTAIARTVAPKLFGFRSPNQALLALVDYDEATIQRDFKHKLYELGLWEADPSGSSTKKNPKSEVQKAWEAVDAVWGDQTRRASKDGDPLRPEPVMNHIAYVANFNVDRLTYRDASGKLRIVEGLSQRDFQTAVAAGIYHDTHEDDSEHPAKARRGSFPMWKYSQIHADATDNIDTARLRNVIWTVSAVRDGKSVPPLEYRQQVNNSPDWIVQLTKGGDGAGNLITMGGLNHRNPQDPAAVKDKQQRYITGREGLVDALNGTAKTQMAEDNESGISTERNRQDDVTFAPWKVLMRTAELLEHATRAARIKYDVKQRRTSKPDSSANLRGGNKTASSTARSFFF